MVILQLAASLVDLGSGRVRRLGTGATLSPLDLRLLRFHDLRGDVLLVLHHPLELFALTLASELQAPHDLHGSGGQTLRRGVI